MSTWAATTDSVIDNGFGGNRNGNQIHGVIIHHAAGTDARIYVANQNNRNSHPTYHIDKDGEVTGIVHPDRRPYSTANNVDNVAVTFELDNSSVGGDWPISNETLAALIDVIADHAKQSGRTGYARNKPGVAQNEFFVGYHSQYVNTACPGPYVTARIDDIVNMLNNRADNVEQAQVMHAALIKTTPVLAWAVNIHLADQARLQAALKGMGRYDGPVDGVVGTNGYKGLQTTATKVGYAGPVDGVLGERSCYYLQVYAKAFGDYSGPCDAVMGPNSWAGVSLGLERK